MRFKKKRVKIDELIWPSEISACAQCFDCGQPKGPDTLVGVCYNPGTEHTFIPDVRTIPSWCPLKKGKD